MSDSTVVFPEGMEHLAKSVETLVKGIEKKREFVKRGRTPNWMGIEEQIADHVMEVEKSCNQVMLQSLNIDAPVVIISGIPHRRVGSCESPYYTMAGMVKVHHTLYREKGTHQGRTVDPVSARAGVIGDGWLPRTARAMAYQLQQGTSREAERVGQEQKRLPYSRASFERVGHLVGEHYVKNHAEIEEVLISEFNVPQEAQSVSVSIDRVSVAIEEPKKRPVGRPRKNAPKKPIERNYRMAYCGTVSLHDKEGTAMHTIRYGRMPQREPLELCQSLAGDVIMMLEQRPALRVSLLADGAPEIWNLFSEVFDKGSIGKEVYGTLYFWHAIEKLHAAASVITSKDEAHKLKNRWKMMLLNGQNAASRILSELETSGQEWTYVGEKQPVHEAITYLTNNKNRMNYYLARKYGLPIGSGIVESTCKSLFEVRMKRPGARWKEHTGEHIVQLRALAVSDRWEEAINLTLKPLFKSVRVAC